MIVDDSDTVAAAQGSGISTLPEEITSAGSSCTADDGNIWQCSAGRKCDRDRQK